MLDHDLGAERLLGKDGRRAPGGAAVLAGRDRGLSGRVLPDRIDVVVGRVDPQPRGDPDQQRRVDGSGPGAAAVERLRDGQVVRDAVAATGRGEARARPARSPAG